MNKDEILTYCHGKISSLTSQMSLVNAERIEALNYYRAKHNIIPSEKGRSSATTNDLMDTIEWAMPAVLEIFCGQDKIVSIDPSEGTDVQRANFIDLLINYQLTVRNPWYVIANDWIKDALIMKLGVLKYSWNRSQQRIKKEYKDLDEIQYRSLSLREDIKIIKAYENPIEYQKINVFTGQIESPGRSLWDVEVEHIIDDEYPKIEVVPPEDFGFNINVADIEKSDFVYHRIYMPKWEAKKTYDYVDSSVWADLKEGQFIGELDSNTFGIKEIRNTSLGVNVISNDFSKDNLVIYECYFYDRENGDPKLAIICDNKVIYYGENIYGKPPFVAITPIKMSHKIMGLSMADLLIDIQRLRTILVRQIIDNLYQSNFRRYFVDPERVNMKDYLEVNTTNAAIRTKGDPRFAAMPEQKAPLPPETFQFWEMLQIERDYHSGIPRSYQGILASVQHRTARGQAQQVQLASQRIQALARLIAEIGIKRLIENLIDMNIKFLSKKTAIRYLNEWVEIEPDNIIGKFDVKVSVGLGIPDRESIIVQCQQLLAIFGQMFSIGVPVVSAQNVYNVIVKMLNAMNIKNVNDYVSNPQVTQGLSQVYHLILPMIGQNPQLAGQVSSIFAMAGVPVKEIQQAVSAAMTPEQTGSESPEQATQPAQPVNPRTARPVNGYYP